MLMLRKYHSLMFISSRYLSTSNSLSTFKREEQSYYPEPKRWPLRNFIKYYPQSPDEPVRRAVYYHHRANIKYSPKKFWYICCLIKGMTVDEAIKQLSFIPLKGAVIAKEIIQEAQEIAVKDHNFPYKQNMFIGECHATKGLVIKSVRKHAFFRMGEIRHFYSHFFLALVEGTPPEKYLTPWPVTGEEKLEAYFKHLRERRIKDSL